MAPAPPPGAQPSRALQASPLTFALGQVFGRLRLDPEPDDPPDDVPDSALPSVKRGLSHFDMLPPQVRLDPSLSAEDKVLYWALVGLCWGNSRETDATNARIRLSLGGETVTEVFATKDGRRLSRQVVHSGPSDDTLQRSYRRLIAAGYLAREDSPTSVSTRMFRLLPLPPLDT